MFQYPEILSKVINTFLATDINQQSIVIVQISFMLFS